MKKGFTLVEILTTIILLAVISALSVPIIDNVIEDSKQSALIQTINSVEKAAANYSVNNNLGYSSKTKAIELKELKETGYLKNEVIYNPVTSKQLEGCVLYRWDDNNKQYQFNYSESCETKDLDVKITTLNPDFNELDWANRDFYVQIETTGLSYNYCVDTKKCSPKANVASSKGAALVSVESNSIYVCAYAIEGNFTSEIVCSSPYKLDKTKPVPGTIDIVGIKGENDWYTSDLSINVKDGIDSLSGHKISVIDKNKLNNNTLGEKVIVTTTDNADNVSTREHVIKIDKIDPEVSITKSVVNNKNVFTAKTNKTTSKMSFQWYKDDKIIEGATASTLETTTAGTYEVKVTTEAGKTAVSNSIKVNQYVITYNLNGGTGTIEKTIKIQDLTTKVTSVVPTRTGYTFLGWGLSKSDTEKTYNSGSNYTDNKNITLFAVWKVNQYDLKLTKGTGIDTIYYKVDGASSYSSTTSSTTIKVNYGSTYSVYATASTGYTYTEYTSSSPLSGTMSTSGATYAPSASDITKPSKPTITRSDYNTFTYSSTDGVGVTGYYVSTSSTKPTTSSTWVTTTTYDIGSSASTYYVWAKDAAGNISDAASITSYKITRSQGTGTTLTTKYESSSGTAFTGTTYVLSGTPIYVSASANTGYTLSTIKHGSTTMSSGTTYTVSASELISSTATLNQYNLTLTKGTGISTIYYKVNGASSYSSTTSSTTIKVNYGSTYSVYATASTGYTYTAYTSSSPLSGTMSTSGATYAPSATANVYTITLNNQSATTSGTTAYYEKYATGNYTTSGATTAISKITSPTKIGYTFGGYYTSTNGSGTQYVDASGNIKSVSTTFTANTTLYAKWTVNSYTCAAGYYLGANATSCSLCSAGSYCGGGTYLFASSTQGKTTCPSGYGSSAAGSSAASQCYKTITVTYSGNGNTGGSTSASSCNAYYNNGSCSITLSGNGFTKTNYTFQGWGTGTSSVTHNASSSYSFSSNTTLNAIWKPKYYCSTGTLTTNSSGSYICTSSNSVLRYDETNYTRDSYYTDWSCSTSSGVSSCTPSSSTYSKTECSQNSTTYTKKSCTRSKNSTTYTKNSCTRSKNPTTYTSWSCSTNSSASTCSSSNSSTCASCTSYTSCTENTVTYTKKTYTRSYSDTGGEWCRTYKYADLSGLEYNTPDLAQEACKGMASCTYIGCSPKTDSTSYTTYSSCVNSCTGDCSSVSTNSYYTSLSSCNSSCSGTCKQKDQTHYECLKYKCTPNNYVCTFRQANGCETYWNNCISLSNFNNLHTQGLDYRTCSGDFYGEWSSPTTSTVTSCSPKTNNTTKVECSQNAKTYTKKSCTRTANPTTYTSWSCSTDSSASSCTKSNSSTCASCTSYTSCSTNPTTYTSWSCSTDSSASTCSSSNSSTCASCTSYTSCSTNPITYDKSSCTRDLEYTSWTYSSSRYGLTSCTNSSSTYSKTECSSYYTCPSGWSSYSGDGSSMICYRNADLY